MRIAIGAIFALFILCFIAIIIEETFLGGRKRRKAEKLARQRVIEAERLESSSANSIK
jgi:Flp pilus assembly protein TadB